MYGGGRKDEDDDAVFKYSFPTQKIDRVGYCCEISSLYDIELNIYLNSRFALIEVGTTLVCNLVGKLDKSIVKNNMANNWEFVTHLDSLERFKLNQLLTLEGEC